MNTMANDTETKAIRCHRHGFFAMLEGDVAAG